jgi:histidinol dehydrogenase
VRSELTSLVEGDPALVAAGLRALVPEGDSVAQAVAEIIQTVVLGGDEAVESLTAQHDTGGTPPPPLRVADAELSEALETLEPSVRAGLQQAIDNVGRVATAALRPDTTVAFEHHEVALRSAPVRRAAVYVPGGRAPYPSTVVMGVVTARAAGVPEVAVCTPPGRDGTVDPAILAACALTEADDVYRMGGAQAIAALAHGTATIRAAEVVVGPGNLYVQEAKRQLSGRVGIDSFAGPSDLMVIADPETDPEPVALDLLAQAEHGRGSLVVGVSTSGELLETLQDRVAAEADTGAVCRFVHVPSTEAALALAEAFAPEHLQLLGPEAEQLSPRITRAGCVFVGAAAGTAFGDYIAGSNHTLPTGGAARFASGLNVGHFRRSFTEVRIADATGLARAAAPVARAEGFEYHARSMEARIRDNGAR